jgi:uncharacterized protein
LIAETLTVGLAAALWAVMFGLGLYNFWISMTFAATLLAGLGFILQRRERARIFHFDRSHIYIGLATAAALYVVFWLGDYISAMILPFAKQQVGGIYGMKNSMDPRLIGLLLLFLIGPAEEVFWRGFLQDRFQKKWGDVPGWLVAGLVYSVVHIWAWNFMLFMAALICGLFWGWVYLRWRSLWPGIISHAVWDVVIFVLLPIQPTSL